MDFWNDGIIIEMMLGLNEFQDGFSKSANEFDVSTVLLQIPT